MVTARFLTGTSEDDAILRVQAKLRANYDRIPLGIPEPLIVGRGINDVAIVTLTLSPKPDAAARWNEKDLYALAEKAPGRARQGGQCRPHLYRRRHRRSRSASSPIRRSSSLLRRHAAAAGSQDPGRQPLLPGRQLAPERPHGRRPWPAARCQGVPDIGLLLVTTRDGRPVYVRDLAKVVIGPSPAEQHVWSMTARQVRTGRTAPAVTVAFAKRAGANAVVVSEALVTARRGAERLADPGRRQCRSHPRLRQDRQRQGQRASVPSGAGHGLDRASDRLCDRLARGGRDPDRHSHHHPADARSPPI